MFRLTKLILYILILMGSQRVRTRAEADIASECTMIEVGQVAKETTVLSPGFLSHTDMLSALRTDTRHLGRKSLVIAKHP